MSVNVFKNGILSKIAGAVGDAVPLINNFLTNQEGKGAADANTVYVLNNKIEEVNNSLGSSDILYNTTIDPTSNGKTITLNNSISDYRFLYMVGGKNNTSAGGHYGSIIPVSVLKSDTSDIGFVIGVNSNNLSIGVSLKYESDTTIIVNRVASGIPAYLYTIYGIK